MLACPQAAHEAEVAERLVAKRRRAALGDITNRPVTADDASSGSSSYAVCAHPPPCRTRPLLGRFGRALMPATAGGCFPRVIQQRVPQHAVVDIRGLLRLGTPPPHPARFVPQPRPLSAGRGRSSAGPLRRAQRHDPTLVRRSSAPARQPLVRSLRRTICRLPAARPPLQRWRPQCLHVRHNGAIDHGIIMLGCTIDLKCPVRVPVRART